MRPLQNQPQDMLPSVSWILSVPYLCASATLWQSIGDRDAVTNQSNQTEIKPLQTKKPNE